MPNLFSWFQHSPAFNKSKIEQRFVMNPAILKILQEWSVILHESVIVRSDAILFWYIPIFAQCVINCIWPPWKGWEAVASILAMWFVLATFGTAHIIVLQWYKKCHPGTMYCAIYPPFLGELFNGITWNLISCRRLVYSKISLTQYLWHILSNYYSLNRRNQSCQIPELEAFSLPPFVAS